MHSLWQNTVQLPAFERLEGNLKTDVLIIGGGLAGILCAYRLQEAGVECAVVEADRIGCGVSGHTTAKITAQHAASAAGSEYGRVCTEYADSHGTPLSPHGLRSEIQCCGAQLGLQLSRLTIHP